MKDQPIYLTPGRSMLAVCMSQPDWVLVRHTAYGRVHKLPRTDAGVADALRVAERMMRDYPGQTHQCGPWLDDLTAAMLNAPVIPALEPECRR